MYVLFNCRVRSHDSGRTLLMVLLFKFGKTIFLQLTGLVTFVKTKAVGLWMGLEGGGGGNFTKNLNFVLRDCVNPTKILLVA